MPKDTKVVYPYISMLCCRCFRTGAVPLLMKKAWVPERLRGPLNQGVLPEGKPARYCCLGACPRDQMRSTQGI